MNSLEQELSGRLAKRISEGNLRVLQMSNYAAIEKSPTVDFFSNDYLGLVTNGVIGKMMETIPQSLCNTGSTGSRLLSGNSAEVMALEKEIASFHNAEAALIFTSGYTANIGLLASIISKHTTVLYDELCHASIIDGIRLSITPHKYKFAHNNLADLAQKLSKTEQGNPVIVVVESVYSMDGDMAPLSEFVSLCGKFDAQLIVDEAHATGVFGRRGEGLVSSLNLQHKIFARVHTFGKALGCHGAAVVGSDLLRQFLINFSRPFIYTTALPPHAIKSITCVYEYLSSPHYDVSPLTNLISYFRQKIETSHSRQHWMDSSSPIQAFLLRGNENSKRLSENLQAQGFMVKAILHPTVPAGSERLRICLHTFNTTAQVDNLFTCIES